MSKQSQVCLGAIAGAHGVKGEFKIRTFTEEPAQVAAYGPVFTEKGDKKFTLSVLRLLKPELVLVRAPEMNSREEAESLKGVRLYVERVQLPLPGDEEFYLEDLVGLTALDENGAPLGVVRAVHNFGAGDILELHEVPDMKGTVLIPFTKAAVPSVDIDNGKLTVSLPQAGLDDASPDKE